MVITMAKLCMAHASMHGARKPPGATMAKLRMAHASTHGARKPPGPKGWWRLAHIVEWGAYKTFYTYFTFSY